jgi:hypothetical protein
MNGSDWFGNWTRAFVERVVTPASSGRTDAIDIGAQPMQLT